MMCRRSSLSTFSPRPGDLLQAFCAQRALQSNTSLFYLGVCGDQVELIYIQKSVADSLADKYMDGSLAAAVAVVVVVTVDEMFPLILLKLSSLSRYGLVALRLYYQAQLRSLVQ